MDKVMEPVGLREMKRRATEHAIEESALRIARAEGLEAVTVKRICTMAFISRSTFFNYFPSRDAAIFGQPLTIPSAERFKSHLDDWSDDILVGIALGVLEAHAMDTIDLEVKRMRLELYLRHPELSHRITELIGSAGPEVETLVEEWLRENPDKQKLDDPKMEAHVVISHSTLLGEELFNDWLNGTSDINQITVDDIVAARERVRERTRAYTG